MMLRAIKSSGLWSVVAALLLAAQMALSLHYVEHKFTVDASAGGDCVICQVASTMAPGASGDPVVLPGSPVAERVIAVSHDLRVTIRPVADFQSRAPPIPVSV